LNSLIASIKEPIKDELAHFEQKFKGTMKSNVALLDTIMSFIIKRKGKQMRPILVMLSAKLHGDINDSVYRGASLIELLHTATLVHDDVVDGAHYRRGFFSVNALWKNKIAVLVGDYLLSRGLLLSIENGDFEQLRLVSTAVREMSEGELLQIEKARHLDIDEETYYKIIRQKTATLLAACCSVGASAVGANKEQVELMNKIGEEIGLAFQIKDDLFDYGEEKIGKPVGIDIKEKKMTLPLIYALNNCKPKTKKWALKTIRNKSSRKKEVKKIIEFVKDSGGLDYASAQMMKHIDQAKSLLSQYPETSTRESFVHLINYVVGRSL
jgi:octaprenyl-diphosphate synthase